MQLARRPALWVIILLAVAVVFPPVTLAEESDPLDIAAKSAIVIDGTTGKILYAKDANVALPPASLTKLFTAFAALEVTPLDRPMTVSQADLVGEASMGLVAGETVSFQTLLYGMMLSSGNDAASTIARNLSAPGTVTSATSTAPFITYLNDRIKQLGMENTHLENPHGLDQDGHVSTARDLAAITMYALNHEPALLTAISTPTYTGDGHQLQQTNALLGSYPGLVGGKTGITAHAGYCLMEVAQRGDTRVITVLLGSTADAWYSDARTLLDYGFSAAGSGTPQTLTAQTAPVVAEAPAASNISGLTINFTGADGAVVSSSTVAAQKTHSPLLWWLAALIAMPCLLIVIVQVARLMHFTQRTRMSPRHSTIPRRSTPSQPAAPAIHWETQPFMAVTSARTPSPVGESFVAPATPRDIIHTPRRQQSDTRYPTPRVSTSFGD